MNNVLKETFLLEFPNLSSNDYTIPYDSDSLLHRSRREEFIPDIKQKILSIES